MKNIITAIALSVATATTASANICNVNPNAIIDYPGYHGIQKSWYDKGEYLFMFSAVSHHADPISYKTWNNVESIVTHYRLDKATCTMSEIEVVITENKERFEAPVVEEIIIEEEIIEDEIIVDVNVTTVTRLAERVRFLTNGGKALKVNRRFSDITTVTDANGNVLSTTKVYYGHSLATKFYKNGTRNDWAQVLNGNGQKENNRWSTHTWNPVKKGTTAKYITGKGNWTAYTPRAGQVVPTGWK